MLSRRRWAPWAVTGVLAPLTLLLVVGPVVAHDQVSGTADVTISARSTLDDRDATVRVGEIVRFVNADGERHRFRSTSGPGRFDTGDLEPGEAANIRLTSTGTYHYRDERNRDSAGYRGIIRVRSAAATTPPVSGPATATPRQATVTIGDRVFLPTTTTVAVGGTVTFENADSDEHTATSAGGGPIDSGTLGSGGTYQLALEATGTFSFLCLIHPDMRGTIEVVAAAPVASSAPVPPPPAPLESAPPIATSPPQATASPTIPAPTSAPADGTAPPLAAEVAIRDFAFDAPAVTVAAGGTVTWTNLGAAPHSATASDGSFDSGTLDASDEFVTTFSTPGTYAYVCAIHPDMAATIEVVEAESASDGSAATASPVAAAGAAAADASPPSPVTLDVSSRAASTTTDAATDLDAAVPIVAGVVLISISMILFARTMRGAVRVADRP